MKSNWIVLGGITVVILSSLFLPILTYSKPGPRGAQPIGEFDRSGVIIRLFILASMFLEWKWRGVLWMILALAGAVWTINFANAIHAVGVDGREALFFGKEAVLEVYPDMGKPTYSAGLFLVIIGYLIITGGGIWDRIQNRKHGGQ